MIGIGLDMSSSAIGFCVFEDDELKHYGKIVPDGKEWRERVSSLTQSLRELIEYWNPEQIVAEDVPLIGGKQSSVLVILGALQGSLLTLATMYEVRTKFIPVGTWRKIMGISTGDKHRDAMKIKSVERCNELYNTNLEINYTKGGNYKSENDDISDSILVYSSTLDKFQPVKKSFGKSK